MLKYKIMNSDIIGVERPGVNDIVRVMNELKRDEVLLIHTPKITKKDLKKLERIEKECIAHERRVNISGLMIAEKKSPKKGFLKKRSKDIDGEW